MLLIFTTGWNLFTGLNWTVRNWTLNWSRMKFQRFQPYFIYFTLYFILLLYIYRLLLAAPNQNFGAFYKKCSNLTGGIKVPARKVPAWAPRAPPPPSIVKLTSGGRGSGGTRRPVTSSTEQHPSTPISNRTRHSSIYWEIRKSLGERARRNYFHLSVEQKNAK